MLELYPQDIFETPTLVTPPTATPTNTPKPRKPVSPTSTPIPTAHQPCVQPGHRCLNEDDPADFNRSVTVLFLLIMVGIMIPISSGRAEGISQT